ncbi:hypothetical protein HOT31_gp090 [Microbacterium phage Hendrix]|uniref:Uncharacterized protein n=1 Tax=Microbacterium phage Hendrix TaxID=2182341 RepID=A0A2U8UU88_9CAUD|nr:hypothetical protein HOT31_gp090 [Microbacterium phage Hendrix]AWN07761.1 hypothetical protein PBI_HENDRIX_90 [Microbacterium phage Hendrix]
MQSQTPQAGAGGTASSTKTKPHSVRTTESLWLSAKRRADSENVTMGFMITEMMDGYARGFMDLPKSAAPTSTAKREPKHSVRTTDQLWASAQRRARSEGITMNDVVEGILSGYTRGLMNLPKVTKTFVATKRAD